jgi:hypothetical protein
MGGGIEESSVVGKRVFLECYHIARLEALTERNIRSGWRAGGLWPVNMSKPLMSRHLVKNNSAPNALNTPITPIEPLSARGARLEHYGHTVPYISTPRKARELRALFRPTGKPTPTERILFRKVEKAFDQKDFRLATLQRRVDELEATVERLKPSKRRRVVPDPNQVFADIENIRQAQEEAGRSVENSEEEESDSEQESEESEAVSCISVVIDESE